MEEWKIEHNIRYYEIATLMMKYEFDTKRVDEILSRVYREPIENRNESGIIEERSNDGSHYKKGEHGHFAGSTPYASGGSSGSSDGSSSGGVDSPKKRLKKMIDDGDVTLELNETMQNRHYKGTNEYNSFLAIGVEKSYFTVPQSELQDFLYRNATKGEVYISSAGDAKERFNFGKVVAFDTKLQKETTWLTAIYSKKRTHFSPYSPMPEEE